MSVLNDPLWRNESQCNEAIEKLLSEALPLVGDIKTQSGNSLAFSAAKRDRQFDVYVGLPTVDDANPAVKNIKEFVSKKLARLGIPARPAYVPSSDINSITIYTEVHAFPIFAINENYGPAGNFRYYKEFLTKDPPAALHLHKDWHTFSDSIPMNNPLQYIEQLKVMTLAQMLGIVVSTDRKEYEGDTGHVLIYKSNTDPQEGWIELGIEKIAISLLTTQSGLISKEIDSLLDTTLTHLQSKSCPDKLFALSVYWYCCLFPLIMEDKFYPQVDLKPSLHGLLLFHLTNNFSDKIKTIDG